LLLALAFASSLSTARAAGTADTADTADAAVAAVAAVAADLPDTAGLVARGVQALLAMQEGTGPAEWPYEGVYRERGEIPAGYRVGGTSLCALALAQAEGWEQDEARRAAVARATDFVLHMLDADAMSTEIEARYDVRGWGHACALGYLSRLQRLGRLPEGREPAVERGIATCLAALAATELPGTGGWNYSRPARPPRS
jgi:hypothetical protein